MNPNASGGNPKPWNRPQSGDENQNNNAAADGGSAAGEIVGGALEATGEIVGGALEVAGGCLDGCSGCSIAILITLFATAGTAMAVFR